MPLSITTEELLQYHYQELSPDKAQAIHEELQINPALRERWEILKSTLHPLDQMTESPRTETVLNVLRYARETTPAGAQ